MGTSSLSLDQGDWRYSGRADGARHRLCLCSLHGPSCEPVGPAPPSLSHLERAIFRSPDPFGTAESPLSSGDCLGSFGLGLSVRRDSPSPPAHKDDSALSMSLPSQSRVT